MQRDASNRKPTSSNKHLQQRANDDCLLVSIAFARQIQLLRLIVTELRQEQFLVDGNLLHCAIYLHSIATEKSAVVRTVTGVEDMIKVQMCARDVP